MPSLNVTVAVPTTLYIPAQAPAGTFTVTRYGLKVPAGEHIGSVMVPAVVLMRPEKVGDPPGHVVGGVRTILRLAEVGTATAGQAFPQMFAAGQMMNKLLDTTSATEPLAGIGAVGPGTDFV